eukprot:16019979-Heterocapsa_arctica.AAC.1
MSLRTTHLLRILIRWKIRVIMSSFLKFGLSTASAPPCPQGQRIPGGYPAPHRLRTAHGSCATSPASTRLRTNDGS